MSKPKLKAKSHGRHRNQYAALPIRFTGEGKMQVLILTSPNTHRWIVPKGWPMRKLSPAATAAQEAYEEAGLVGTIQDETPIGHYQYDKRGDDGSRARVRVEVFLFRVSGQLPTWPEQAERETCWCDPEEAPQRVEEPELAAIMLTLRDLAYTA